MHSLGNNAHAQANHRQWSRDAHNHTRTHSLTINGHVTRASPTLTFIGHVMHPRARITHTQPRTHASHTPSRAHTHSRACALNTPEAYFYYYLPVANIYCLSIPGYNLRFIVCHEFGHSLGLDHTKVDGSVMTSGTRPYNPNMTLSDDDIKGVQSLYRRR